MASLKRYRSEGELVKLKAAVHNAKLDYELRDRATVDSMLDVVVRATKQKHICEKVVRRALTWNFSVKDARCLEAAVQQLRAMELGPKLWKDPQYPLLPRVQELIPYLPHAQHLSKAFQEGPEAFTAAWVQMMTSDRLSLPLDLEVSTARWLLDLPDPAMLLRKALGDGAKEILDFAEDAKVSKYPIMSEDVKTISDTAYEKLKHYGGIGKALALAGGSNPAAVGAQRASK